MGGLPATPLVQEEASPHAPDEAGTWLFLFLSPLLFHMLPSTDGLSIFQILSWKPRNLSLQLLKNLGDLHH